MTAESNPPNSNPSRKGVVVPLLAIAAIGIVLRFTFVDALTKLTGTWIGGVESPQRRAGASDQSGATVEKGSSAD
jgi:hypothetical protein